VTKTLQTICGEPSCALRRVVVLKPDQRYLLTIRREANAVEADEAVTLFASRDK
jgi:hypothetical protein